VVVTDEQVHQALEQLREEQAQYIPVEHRGVRKGDIITIDISGQAETGQPVLNQTDASYLVAEETPFSIPGFLPRLEGMEIGQEKTFSVDLPADLLDHRLAGQQATITVRLKGIKEKSLPALDDELAKAYGYESLAALTDFIRSSLQKEMEQDARDRLERRLLQAIAEVSTVEFPPRLVEDEVNTLLRRRDEGLRRRGLSLDMYFRLTNTSEEQMRDQLRPIAYERVRNTLILDELAKKEGVEVQPTEVQAEIDRLITGAGNEADSVRRLFATEGQRELLHYTMVQRKLLDSLIARVTAGQPARPRAEIEAVTSPSEGKQEDRLPDGMIVAPD
jgi:trigger factor